MSYRGSFKPFKSSYLIKQKNYFKNKRQVFETKTIKKKKTIKLFTLKIKQ